jgi:plasmid stabilization system protein ParE
MSLSISFRRAAREEFIESANWYKGKSLQLGLDFISEIERSISLAAENPLHYELIHKEIRRIVAKRFPFSVYFRVEAKRIVVLAVFHGKRDSALWKARN